MELSIPIPVYNFAEFLPQTLDSILSQEGVGQVKSLLWTALRRMARSSLFNRSARSCLYRKPHPVEKGCESRKLIRC
jgi:hypothetical protein